MISLHKFSPNHLGISQTCGDKIKLQFHATSLKISVETAWQFITEKYDAAMPTEALVCLDCFITKLTQCFRESLPVGVRVISRKNNEDMTQ
jgi:hypothetical protein